MVRRTATGPPPRSWLLPVGLAVTALAFLQPGGARAPAWADEPTPPATEAAAEAPEQDGAQPPATPGDLVVRKQVDANRDGIYGDEEDAPSATSDVSFRITVSNIGAATLEVTAVVDDLGSETIDLLNPDACPSLGAVLEPNASVTCDLVLERYLRTWAAQPRSVLTNVVEVVATDGAVSISGSDDATVRNPAALVVIASVDLANDADGDGVHGDDEQAPAPGSDVPVRIEVANLSPGAVTIAGLVGDWGDQGPVDLLATACPELDGMRLWGAGGSHADGGDHDDGDHDDGDHDEGAPDVGGHDDGPGGPDHASTVVCHATLVAHAPPAGHSRTDTVTATLAKRHAPERRASARDATTVWVAAPPEPPTEPPTEPPATEPPTEPATQPPATPTDGTSPTAPGEGRPTASPVGTTPSVATAATSAELPRTGLSLRGWGMGGFASLALGLALVRAARPGTAPAVEGRPRRP